MRYLFFSIYSFFLWSYIILFFAIVPIFALPFSLVAGKKNAFRFFFKFFCRIWLFIFRVPVTVKGLENLSGKAQIILISNHVSILDQYILNAALPEFFNFVVTARVLRHTLGGIINWGAGLIERKYGNFLVGSKTIQKIMAVIKGGDSFIFLPSERVTADGGLGKRISRAIYGIIQTTDAAILPVHIKGGLAVKFYQEPYKVQITIGKPISKQELFIGGDEYLRKTIASL